MHGPVNPAWQPVVVLRDTPPQKAQHVLVPEVEPPEAVASRGAGVAQSGQYVPGSGDGQEEEQARKRPQLAPVSALSGEQQEQSCCRAEQYKRDQAFAEHRQGQRSPHDVRVEQRPRVPGHRRLFAHLGPGYRGGVAFHRDRAQRLEEGEQRRAQKQRQPDLRDQDARKQKDAYRGHDADGRVEPGARAEGLVGPAMPEQHQQQHGQGLRQMRRERVEAEDAEAGRRQPVGQRRFFKVANAIYLERYEVAGGGHGARGTGVGGVGVIQDGRSKERRKI